MFCVFCKIVNNEIPSAKLYEDDTIVAFKDLNPQAPVHFLVIPKVHIPSVDGIDGSNSAVAAHIFEMIPKIAKDAGIVNGYRVITNCGDDACQSVHHLHFHVLGGMKMAERMA